MFSFVDESIACTIGRVLRRRGRWKQFSLRINSVRSDEDLGFERTLEECQQAACEFRAELRKDAEEDGQENFQLRPMAIYQITLRNLTPEELIRVLNQEATLIDLAMVDKRIVAVVDD